MEIKTKRMVEEIINIELPYYCKSSITYYKIVSETHVLSVGTYSPEIAFNDYSMSGATAETNVEVSQEEFETVYATTLMTLNEKL
jgi:hypothetical protein